MGSDENLEARNMYHAHVKLRVLDRHSVRLRRVFRRVDNILSSSARSTCVLPDTMHTSLSASRAYPNVDTAFYSTYPVRATRGIMYIDKYESSCSYAQKGLKSWISCRSDALSFLFDSNPTVGMYLYCMIRIKLFHCLRVVCCIREFLFVSLLLLQLLLLLLLFLLFFCCCFLSSYYLFVWGFVCLCVCCCSFVVGFYLLVCLLFFCFYQCVYYITARVFSCCLLYVSILS